MSILSRNTAAAHPATETYARHVNPAFVRLLGVFGYGRVFVRARGVSLWDHEGREYLDFLSGFGSVNLGYNHPRLVARLREFLLEDAPNVLHVGPSPHAAALAEALSQAAGPPLSMSLFTNSGSEAVEAGLKLARAATGRTAFLYCNGGFHGTNLGALSVMGAPRLRQPFEPLLPQCEAIPFGDLPVLEQALRKRRPAAFLVEPIQSEGGVVLPPTDYLKQAQALCKKHGTLLILDEVQTGLGRTGSLFMYQAEDFVPDVLVLAKSLGGSLLPMGAALTSRELVIKAYGTMERFDLHGSTFSGNAFGCAAALETLRILQDGHNGKPGHLDLIGNAKRMGRLLVDLLRERLAGHPLVREVRGRGLLVGVELGPTDRGLWQRLAPALFRGVAKNVLGQWLAVRLLEHGIVAQPASQEWNVLKLEPSLLIEEHHIQQVVGAIAEILADYRDLAPLLKDVASRVGAQFASGWSFR